MMTTKTLLALTVLLAAICSTLTAEPQATRVPTSRQDAAKPGMKIPVLPPISPLLDYPIRDTSIAVGPDGTYYLTGTTGSPSWWTVNDGIRIWKSRDLKSWEPLGLVWSFAKDATWQAAKKGKCAIWAPELHYFNNTFWIAYSINDTGICKGGGTGILRSTSGKAEGPYVDVKPDGPLTGRIDASLFQDDDGQVYFVWQNGMIARMKKDMSGLAEEPRLLKPSNAKEVGFEGAFLTKINGRYHLIASVFGWNGLPGYHCTAASSDSIYGPYGEAYLAIPHGGHNVLFQDNGGRWYSTFFGNDPGAPFRERAAIVPIRVNAEGRIEPGEEELASNLTAETAAASAAPSATNAFNPTYKADWRWVHGAVFVPTSAINEAQMWDDYNPVINDRELHYASLYGINLVRVYLHYFSYLKDKERFQKNIEDFLARADKYGINVELVFFDDCWNEPSKDILKPNYKYPNPVFGVHNSRWLLSPGHEILKNYEKNRTSLKAYVQEVVKAHLNDPRIAFWETYNEPHKETPGLLKLLKDSREWIHETGSKIPVTATGGEFCGDPYSDFLTWHNYSNDYPLPKDPVHELNTECMCRKEQSIPGIIQHFKGKTGFIIWEFGIGRDDCRFYWGETTATPAADEHDKPFHGLVYADGHPWATEDIKAWLGDEAYARLPVYHVTYFRDTDFKSPAKESITPSIDFDLKDEIGYGSPDTSVHLAKDYYSIRWTGDIESQQAGTATLFVKSDGAVKVTVDGKAVIDTSKDGKGTSSEVTGTVELAAGKPTPITVEYIHETGPASIHLDWTPPKGQRSVLFPVSHP